MQEVVGKSYYDENYGDYESQNSPGKLRFYLTLMKNWVSKGSAVFELGTGLGNFLALAAQYYECSGCDVNTYGVACTRKKAPNANLYEGSYETIPKAIGDDVGGLDHRHPEARVLFHQRLVDLMREIPARQAKADRFDASSHHDVFAINDDAAGRRRDCVQA